MARLRRVPYEWILGAMFVASFGFFPRIDWFVGRAIWLVVAGLCAGRSLGVTPRPGAPGPRSGLPLFTGAIGCLYFPVLLWAASNASREIRFAS